MTPLRFRIFFARGLSKSNEPALSIFESLYLTKVSVWLFETSYSKKPITYIYLNQKQIFVRLTTYNKKTPIHTYIHTYLNREKLITRLSKRKERFIGKQSRHYSVSSLMNHHQNCDGMILVMLNQRWRFISTKYKNLGKFVKQEKVGRLIRESVFDF